MPLPIDMTLSEIDLGAVDAEADSRLADYFVETPYVRSALSLDKTHILGRKGSGKSALFMQLPRLLGEWEGGASEVVQLTPDQYAWNQLKEYREQGIQAEQAHASAWKFTIAIEIAAALTRVSEERLNTTAALDAQRVLRTFMKENYGDAWPSMNRTAAQLLKGVSSFNLQAFGFGVGFTRDRVEQPLTPAVLVALFEAINTVTAEWPVVVAFDKLDDSWDGSSDSMDLLIGLLKAAKEINDSTRRTDPFRASVLVFLRSDIYEGLRFDDKDKHRPTEEHITWSPDQLKEMVNKRLPNGIIADDLFEPGDMRGSIAPFNYIVKRTFLRPREAIQFLQKCIDIAGRDVNQITKDQVRSAEEQYSAWKVEDLKQEYRRLHPSFETLLESLRQGQHRYDSLAEFDRHLRSREPQQMDNLGTRHAAEMLFNASVIGIRLRDSGSPKFRCEDSTLVLPSEGAVYVHQSLYRGLNIRERRSRD